MSIAPSGRLVALVLVVLLSGCDAGAPDNPVNDGSDTVQTPASPSESDQLAVLPTGSFADISEDPVSEEMAAAFQAALADMADGGGMAATVLSPTGTWSGAVGKADSRRDVGIDDQFAIGSVTKPLVAAQLMQLVEAGGLRLDDPANRYLPAGLDFDTNDATIRQLMGMRSGIPDYWPEIEGRLTTDRQRVWTTADMLALVPAERTPAGTTFDYSNTNYLLLQHVIEQVTGRAVVKVMREGGVLDIDGIERLVYQPDERPTAPMALPDAMSPAEWKKGRGYLPSIASATLGPTTGSIATDSLSLAHWWQAFCAGEIVSQDSLNEMTDFEGGYGLGLYQPYAGAVGHTGMDIGYVAWAGCLPDDGTVIVVLTNQVFEDIGLMAGPLVLAADTASQ